MIEAQAEGGESKARSKRGPAEDGVEGLPIIIDHFAFQQVGQGGECGIKVPKRSYELPTVRSRIEAF